MYSFTKISAFLLCFTLTACSDGPTNVIPLAKQGLLSGAISNTRDTAVIGSIHHGGSFWDLKKKERLFNWNHESGKMSAIRAVAISKDGTRAVTCVEDSLVLWDTTSGEYKQFWKADDRILSIALNSKGNTALMGLRDGTVSYFDLDKGQALYNFKHLAEVRKVSISKDGKIGISAGDDKSVKVYDLESGIEIHTKMLSNQIKTVAISDSGSLVFATAQREDSIIWDIEQDKIIYKKHNRVTNYTSADFSDNEQQLSLGSFTGEIVKLDIKTGKITKKWQAKPRQAYGSAASKSILDLVDNGQTVYALTSDGMFETFK